MASAIWIVDGRMDKVNWESEFHHVRIDYCKQLKKGDVVWIWSVSNRIWVKANVSMVTAYYVYVLYEVSGKASRKWVPKFSDTLMPASRKWAHKEAFACGFRACALYNLKVTASRSEEC